MGSKSSKIEKSKASTNSSNAVITPSDRAQLELKLQRDKLAAAVRRYERAASDERSRAADFLRSGNRRKALYCLKRQKAQEQQVTCVGDMLDNVQKLIDTIEFKQIEMEVVDALKSGKNELSKLNAMLNIDDISELMESTTETVEEARRINEVLSQPLGTWDDDELLDEIRLSLAPAEEKKGDNTVEDAVVPTHPLPDTEIQESKEDLQASDALLSA